MSDSSRIYVGIDWATEAHQVCVLGPDRKVLSESSVPNTADGLAVLAAALAALAGGDPAQVSVAIEVPRGAVVETLVERGFRVFSINPKQLDRFRDRHTVAGAKDDRRDAYVLADSLATDEHCFRAVRIDDPIIIQIRELSRVDDDLQVECHRLSGRLREQVLRISPVLLRLCPAANEAWFWKLLELAFTPEGARTVRKQQVAKLLTGHRIRRHTTDAVLAALQAPHLRVAPGTDKAAAGHIRLIIPRLRLADEQRTACGRDLDGLLRSLAPEDGVPGQDREHRDVEILRSLPGVGRIVAATMLAEASQPLAERDYHALRAMCGVAPTTRQSGKRTVVVMRRACNPRLREAMYHAARVATQRDPACRARYAAFRQRGHTHGRALRGVADHHLRVLVAMLNSRSLFTSRPAPQTPASPDAVAA